MEYQVTLNNGDKFKVIDSEFNSTEFTEKMNSPQIICIDIGGVPIMKHSFISAIPVSLITEK